MGGAGEELGGGQRDSGVGAGQVDGQRDSVGAGDGPRSGQGKVGV